MKSCDIIVCTRNRIESLKATIASIMRAAEHASGIDYCLIIVDNGSTDGTASYLRCVRPTTSLRVQLLHEGKPGLGHARNAGLSSSRADVVVFTDDDCVMDASYFEALRSVLSRITGPFILGGAVELGDELDLPFTITGTREAAPLESHQYHPSGFVLGANMIITRAALRDVGRFDGRFGAGSVFQAAEETDYILRAAAKRIRVQFEPSLKVYHFHGRRTIRQVRSLCDSYAIGNGALLAKHRDKRLVRALAFSVRMSIKELLLWRNLLDGQLELSHCRSVVGTLRGVARYVRWSLARGT